jgi:hypothetical protein
MRTSRQPFHGTSTVVAHVTFTTRRALTSESHGTFTGRHAHGTFTGLSRDGERRCYVTLRETGCETRDVLTGRLTAILTGRFPFPLEGERSSRETEKSNEGGRREQPPSSHLVHLLTTPWLAAGTRLRARARPPKRTRSSAATQVHGDSADLARLSRSLRVRRTGTRSRSSMCSPGAARCVKRPAPRRGWHTLFPRIMLNTHPGSILRRVSTDHAGCPFALSKKVCFKTCPTPCTEHVADT